MEMQVRTLKEFELLISEVSVHDEVTIGINIRSEKSKRKMQNQQELLSRKGILKQTLEEIEGLKNQTPRRKNKIQQAEEDLSNRGE